MHIGIDARELVGQRTGVGRYLADLCTEWRSTPDAAHHRFTLFAHAPGNNLAALGDPFLDGPAGRFRYHPIPGNGGSRWEQGSLARALAHATPDVLFAPAYTAPLTTRVPVVLTIHDISFTTHPEWFSWREGLRRRWLTRLAARRATRVIAVSDFTRHEICRNLGLSTKAVSVVWSGIRHPPALHAISREPIVLFVGSTFNRRHIPELIRAFALVARRVPLARLVLVGDNRSFPFMDPVRLAARAGLADRIHVTSYIDETELALLYAKAKVFVFLSEYEGFGLPPLEAMAAGIPVVVGDTPVARELYADAARRVPVDDITAIGDALTTLLVDEAAGAKLRDAASIRMARFTWSRAARETLTILEHAGAR